MKLIHKITAYLAIALGALHLGFAAGASNFNLNVLWFTGAGLAIVFAGFLNLAFIRNRHDRLVRLFCIIADLTLTILFVYAFFTVLNEPQVVLGGLVFALAAAFSILQKSE